MPSNDNNSGTAGATPPMPDPHGHAALLLVESLIHGLIERSIINISDAVEIVERADSVQIEVAEAADGHGAPMWRSHALLVSIIESLKLHGDGDGTYAPPHSV